MTRECVTVGECCTLRLLKSWGWTYDQINAYYCRGNDTISRHVNRECQHEQNGPAHMVLPGPSPTQTARENVQIGNVWTWDGFEEV